MYSCPACGAEVIGNRLLCACGADLSLLARLDAVADAWFNEALASLEQGRPGRALEWMSACCAARPTDAAARCAQAKIWARLGRWQEAHDSLERAAALDPGAPDLQTIRDAIKDGASEASSRAGESIQGPVPASRGGTRPRRSRTTRRVRARKSRG